MILVGSVGQVNMRKVPETVWDCLKGGSFCWVLFVPNSVFLLVFVRTKMFVILPAFSRAVFFIIFCLL